MLLSKKSIYGIRSVLYIAKEQQEKYLPISRVSKELDISFHFLTKILQELTQIGIMVSYRGPNGGVSLAKPPEEVLLLDIVTALDGTELFTECVLGLPGCGSSAPCPLHDSWGTSRDNIHRLFKETTIAMMVTDINDKGLRLGELGL